MQKLLKFSRNCIVFILWTIFFVFVVKNLLYVFWRFDILSVRSWQTISNYWNSGGVFKTAPDITLLFLLILLPFIYIFGFIKTKKINFFKLIFSLFAPLFKEKIEDPERIVIKGIKSTEQYVEEIKSEIEAIKPEKNKESSSIRSNILKKFNNEIKK